MLCISNNRNLVVVLVQLLVVEVGKKKGMKTDEGETIVKQLKIWPDGL